MTNKELQELLKKFPEDLEIIVEHEKSKNQFRIKNVVRYLSEDGKLFLDVYYFRG